MSCPSIGLRAEILESAEELRDVLLRRDEQEDAATQRAVIRGFNTGSHDYFSTSATR